MKWAMMVSACLALLLGATTAQAQDSAKPTSKLLVGVGLGSRMVTGDTPVPRLGETVNLTQAGVHAVFNLNPQFSIVGDWTYGWRNVNYEASGGGSTITNKSEARGWNLNGLFAVSRPVGSNGGQLYCGPGFALINMSADEEKNNNGTITNTQRKFGTNLGFGVGVGGIMPFTDKWHAFFSFRHTVVTGHFIQSTSGSSVDGDVPVGGTSALVGAGMGF